jgi:hypothetical protein
MPEIARIPAADSRHSCSHTASDLNVLCIPSAPIYPRKSLKLWSAMPATGKLISSMLPALKYDRSTEVLRALVALAQSSPDHKSRTFVKSLGTRRTMVRDRTSYLDAISHLFPSRICVGVCSRLTKTREDLCNIPGLNVFYSYLSPLAKVFYPSSAPIMYSICL